MKEILSAVKEKPKHYTNRLLVSKFEKQFRKENVLAAIHDLQEEGAVTFTRKDLGNGKKGQYVLSARKAA